MTDPTDPAYAVVPMSAEPPELPGPTLLGQGWRDLTFLHWRVDPARVAPLLPAGTEPDVFDGSTWVGLIPFRLVGAHFGRGPALPYVGTFPETNVRFYSVDGEGAARRGVRVAGRGPAAVRARRPGDAGTQLHLVADARAAVGQRHPLQQLAPLAGAPRRPQ